MAMKKVTVDGKTLNKRTANMLHRAEQRLGEDLYVVQGSYNAGGVSASAGTHDGGGALDVSPTDHPDKVVKQLREVGFAAWHRTPDQGPWNEHIHAIAIGDREMSSGAHNQVTAYYNGRNGLANNLPDDGPRLSPIPVWPVKLDRLSLARLQWQFRTKNPKKGVTAVRRVQQLLNYRMGTNLVADGLAGPKTKAAWRAWEKKIGNKNPDTVPGLNNLKQLAAGWYKVVLVLDKK